MLLKIKGGSAKSTFAGELGASAFKLDASGTNYSPTVMSFAGSVARNGVSFFDGSFNVENLNYSSFNAKLPVSNTNSQTSRVGFVGNINIPTRSPLRVNMVLNQKETGNSVTYTGDASGQYVQGDLTINFSGSSNAAGTVSTLESTKGVKIVLDKSIANTPITVNGVTQGNYSTSNGLLTYIDSSYEQY